MRRRSTSSKNGRAGLNTLLALAIAVGLVACGSFLTLTRQGWNPSYGPVVPHDSFPSDCALCHEGNEWTTIKKDFTFDHAKVTGLALNGAHEKVQCLLCHNDRGPAGDFAARGCAGCHQDVHSGQLGHLCANCHTEDSWQPSQPIAQHNRTGFPLVGSHAVVACFRCHPGAQANEFTRVDTACASCHQTALANATSPNHAANGWVDNCQRCHTPISWKPANFAHPASFPLTAGHAGQACTECHSGGVFTGLSTNCVSCHLGDFQGTTSPNHASAGFSMNCRQCHNTAGWSGANFKHTSSFPLTGGHAGQNCSECHTGGVYTGLSNDCASCHLDDYQHVTNPNHVASGFSTNCTDCHNTITWSGANLTHPTSFPLTNGHAGHSCADCHNGGVYTGLSPACSSCHMPQYNATTNPNHAAAGFPTSCNPCHNTISWQGATFTHPSSFPLTGGHAGQNCSECHAGGVYTGLSPSCSSCHMPQYNSTTNPNHAAAGFPTNCNPCHNTSTWQGATFTHNFPITSGPHHVACTQCHQNSSNYQDFSCTGCHAHSQASMAKHHSGVSGYAWISQRCYDCHPNGHH